MPITHLVICLSSPLFSMCGCLRRRCDSLGYAAPSMVFCRLEDEQLVQFGKHPHRPLATRLCTGRRDSLFPCDLRIRQRSSRTRPHFNARPRSVLALLRGKAPQCACSTAGASLHFRIHSVIFSSCRRSASGGNTLLHAGSKGNLPLP